MHRGATEKTSSSSADNQVSKMTENPLPSQFISVSKMACPIHFGCAIHPFYRPPISPQIDSISSTLRLRHASNLDYRSGEVFSGCTMTVPFVDGLTLAGCRLGLHVGLRLWTEVTRASRQFSRQIPWCTCKAWLDAFPIAPFSVQALNCPGAIFEGPSSPPCSS